MLPIFQITADDKDITNLIQDRLLSIQIVDRVALASDTLALTIDDRDNMVAFPKKGATLKVLLGWEGGSLSIIGEYTVDEIEISGPPRSISIRGKPADMSGSTKNQQRHSWEKVTVSQIVKEIAGRNKWEAACPIETKIERIDQVDESDLNFITRLARLYGATASVKGKKLLVLPRSTSKNASGGTMPAISITPDMVSSYRLLFPNRYSVGKVVAKTLDKQTGGVLPYEIENKNPAKASSGAVHTERHLYPDEETAKSAAQAKMDELNRQTVTGSLEMRGRADIVAELEITAIN